MQQQNEQEKQWAALSYLWIFSLIILIAKRDNAFVQWHARQGLVLFLLSIVLWPFPILRNLEIIILALMTLGFIQAALGSYYSLPFIGDLTRNKMPEIPKINKAPNTQELLNHLEEDEKKIKKLEEELKKVRG